MAEFAILPLGSQVVHERLPHIKSLLLYGAPKTGKTMLAHVSTQGWLWGRIYGHETHGLQLGDLGHVYSPYGDGAATRGMKSLHNTETVGQCLGNSAPYQAGNFMPQLLPLLL